MIQSNSKGKNICFIEIYFLPFFWSPPFLELDKLSLKYGIPIYRCALNYPFPKLKEIIFWVLFLVCKVDSFTIIRHAITIVVHLHYVTRFDIPVSDVMDVHEYKTKDWISEYRKVWSETHWLSFLFNYCFQICFAYFHE